MIAAGALAQIGVLESERDRRRAEQLAVKATAEILGNTPAVARSSYIDPRIWARYRDGDLLDPSLSPESAIRKLLRAQQ